MTAGPQGMDVAHPGSVENERVDTALAQPALQRTRPFRERGLIFARGCHADTIDGFGAVS